VVKGHRAIGSSVHRIIATGKSFFDDSMNWWPDEPMIR